ncbi:hypothetical protein BLA29_010307 [Euroglyphus maynei]|uniref:Uncharacterized protein n=1 Tax=Euroglyphus maynei TaxID=6958 RepID=A0A1Y3AY66_EURMA|nr:hypothetical protein BLA29_010307 [Euroglyphus maynei]
MLGRKGFAKLKSPQKNDKSANNSDENQQQQQQSLNKEHSIMDDNDYIVTNLNISREMGFIIGIAITDNNNNNGGKKNKSKRHTQHKSYLFSYNLNGVMIKYMEINVNAKDKENVILQTTRDGEYIIFTENGNTIKILRTFDLIPLYAFNMDSSSNIQPEKIRSLSLVDFKYIIVGLENGKLLVYNIDFNRWNHEYNNRF